MRSWLGSRSLIPHVGTVIAIVGTGWRGPAADGLLGRRRIAFYRGVGIPDTEVVAVGSGRGRGRVDCDCLPGRQLPAGGCAVYTAHRNRAAGVGLGGQRHWLHDVSLLREMQLLRIRSLGAWQCSLLLRGWH